jgi:hypothetical protein
MLNKKPVDAAYNFDDDTMYEWWREFGQKIYNS